jgi:penicillin-binding protein 1A
MAEALKDVPKRDFRQPPGVMIVRVNPATGQLAGAGEKNALWEPFIPGTEPGSGGNVLDGSMNVNYDSVFGPGATGNVTGTAIGTGGLY